MPYWRFCTPYIPILSGLLAIGIFNLVDILSENIKSFFGANKYKHVLFILLFTPLVYFFRIPVDDYHRQSQIVIAPSNDF